MSCTFPIKKRREMVKHPRPTQTNTATPQGQQVYTQLIQASTQQPGPHNTTKGDHRKRWSLTPPPWGHLSAPHRAPLHGVFKSRPTPGKASLTMEAATVDTREGPVAPSKKSPKPHDVPSIGLSPNLPLVNLQTGQSDHRAPKGVLLVPWRTLRKDNHLQSRPKALRHHPAEATPHDQGQDRNSEVNRARSDQRS
jgi:hypothetical protein